MYNDLIRRLRWQQKPGAESETTLLMSEAADALEAMQAALASLRLTQFGTVAELVLRDAERS